MTTPLVPPYYLDEPPHAPAPSYGLFNVALGPMDAPTPWATGGGVQFNPDWCTQPRLFPAPCDTTPPTKTFDAIDALTPAFPFKVYATLQCGSQTFNFEEMQRRVQARLLNGEQTGVEQALIGRGGAVEPNSLFQSGLITVTNLGPSTTVVAGVSNLEQQLATCYGHVGILHMRPRVAAYMADRKQLRWGSDGICRTMRGNLVSIGDGYSGRGPGDQATTATTDWVYISGRVDIWRSPDVLLPDPRQTFDRSLNQYMLLAERDYAMTVECCVAVTEVTLA